MICGLTTEEIARAFLQPEATIAQRIVRAKRTLSESGLAYETPRGEELSERLASVLEVVYLIFNEGYTAARGDEWLRPQLCNDALRMGRVLTRVAPQEAEAHGLLALMELNASRIAARTDAAGDPILLMDQNRDAMGPASDPPRLARAGAGVRARRCAWILCAAGGDRRLSRQGRPRPMKRSGRASQHSMPNSPALVRSPIIELNRAVAVGMAEGPAAALAIVDALAGEPALKNYHLLESVRGDLLFKLGRFAEARTAFEAAARLAGNKREHELLQRRVVEAARRSEIAR